MIDPRISLAGQVPTTQAPSVVMDIFQNALNNNQNRQIKQQGYDQQALLNPIILEGVQRANELGGAQQPALINQANLMASPESQAVAQQAISQKIRATAATRLKPYLDANDLVGANNEIELAISTLASKGVDTNLIAPLVRAQQQLKTQNGLQQLKQITDSFLGVQQVQPKVGTFRFMETPTGIAKLNTVTGEQTETILTSKEVDLARKQTAEQLKATIKQDDATFDKSKKIRDRHDKLSDEFIKVRDSYDRVRSSEKSAAGDIALIFNYMKMLDPGSVVREGEFATAQNAGGVDDRVWNSYNRLLTGERLNPKQRKSFESQSEKLFNVAEQRNKSLIKETIGIAEQFGVTKEDVFGLKPQSSSGFKILSVK